MTKKLKARNPKHETRNKFKCFKHCKFQRSPNRFRGFGFFEIWIYLTPVCFGFRYSDFGFNVMASLRDKAEPFVLAILEEQI